MNRTLAIGYAALVIGVLAVGAWMGSDQVPAPKACPNCPAPPVQPTPSPPRPGPWDPRWASVDAAGWWVENKAPDGSAAQIDYPADQWIRNIGSKIDGAGMCVFSSFEMMCRWAGLEEFRGFRDWCAQNYPGGGYPEKLAKLVKAYCAKKGIQEPVLYQYEGNDPKVIEQVMRTGRFACITLYNSKRYGGRISHMVNCGHADGRIGCIVDNNQMGRDSIPPYEWFPSTQALMQACGAGGRVWVAWIERPGAPPMPRN